MSEAPLYKDFSIAPLMQTLDSIKKEFEDGMIFLKGIIDEKIIASVRGTVKNNTAIFFKTDDNLKTKKRAIVCMQLKKSHSANCSRGTKVRNLKIKSLSRILKIDR
ncbi:MAG: hypothetical protein PW786_10060 [Arachidicoccus sp.]|nr:hypothetical protein [Arachidicoccus sp.]